MAAVIPTAFTAREAGQWRIDSVTPIVGASLARAPALHIAEGDPVERPDGVWTLRGVTSNERYANRQERAALAASQQPLGRTGATRAVLIPIRKNEAWWELTQDARRELFEERSRHIAIGLTALPAVARRLHHSRDLGEPFDFLTWFEFAPEHTQRFDGILQQLRESEEWSYIDREVEIRLSRPNPADCGEYVSLAGPATPSS